MKAWMRVAPSRPRVSACVSSGMVPPIKMVGGPISSRQSADVEGEGERLVARRHPEGDPLHRAEQEREEQRQHADAHLGQAVHPEQRRRPPLSLGPLHRAARDPAEQGVAGREAAQVQAQHRRRRLAVAAQQRGEVLLPGDLVDETAEPGQKRQEQGDGACHRGSLGSR